MSAEINREKGSIDNRIPEIAKSYIFSEGVRESVNDTYLITERLSF